MCLCVIFSADYFVLLFLHNIVSKMEKNNHILALTKLLMSILELQNTALLLAAEANHSRMNVKIISHMSFLCSFKWLKAGKSGKS